MTRLNLVQTSPAWESAATNLAKLTQLVDRIDNGIVILPEMFSTGFSMASAKLAEPMSGPTVSWMLEAAKQRGLTLCGSVIIQDGQQFYNRFVWATDQGVTATYDKRHLFRMADEDRYYSPGQAQVVIESSGISVCPQICYDLRFPAWSRGQFDLLLYVANWPASRSDHWLALLRARAIENLCYVVGVNRLGIDGNRVEYRGDSCVIDFRGDLILDMADRDAVESCELDLPALYQYRDGFPAYLDADQISFR